MALLMGGAFLAYKFSKSSVKSKPYKRNGIAVDLSVFDSPDMPGSGNCMERRLIAMLHNLSLKTGYPIFSWINSGARSEAHNRKLGGLRNSSHKIPTCKAVDIRASSKSIRNNLAMAARDVGFKRIGVGNTFVHLDVDEGKSQYVAWGYLVGLLRRLILLCSCYSLPKASMK
ncbi:D-Ala-D-Ala carboxypeptidase family metallohydrolase [Nonlabens agnitus]|uniref:D-Ala-D-Ala carboxypeptidase family metallohydrolase n=1 Tax=Nonlabens agnitus TaxID=870484 RepID=UPI001F5B4AA0|nr:D-Ala-D-Ala carboxypeptidase family metallohydrolase [Nonlabens agnitus]